MLTLLNELLRKVFMDGVRGLIPAGGGSVESGQVGFEPPEDVWRKHVSSLQRNALNVYLADVRENRKLRSNERVRNIENGVVYESPAPLRIDCHYLVSAWTPGTYTPGSLQPAIEPTLDEHKLLYEAARVLTSNAPFNASRIYPAGSSALNAWPESFRDVDLPVTIAPAEGFPKLAEFWGTMGQTHPWKPVIYLSVTIPVELTQQVAGPVVTTRITEYRRSGRPDPAEVWIEIGGTVYDKTGQPVPGAWVQIEALTGEPWQPPANTDDTGRFQFNRLKEGQYILRTRSAGLGEYTRIIDVPSPGGGYDLTFT